MGIYTSTSPERVTCYFLHALMKIFSKQFTVDFPNRDNSSICTRISLMSTSRKQKKTRKSRGLELLSDIENLDIVLGERQSERDGSANSNSARRPESDKSENNEENLYLNHTETRSGNDADLGQNSTSANSNADINRLSSEFNSRLSREMDEMMSSGNTQIQRAISDAISNQMLPQIQNGLRAGSGHVTQNRWNVLAERPEINSEGYRN